MQHCDMRAHPGRRKSFQNETESGGLLRGMRNLVQQGGFHMRLLFVSTALGALALAGSAYAQDWGNDNYVELNLGSGVFGKVHANQAAQLPGFAVHGNADT